MFEKQRLTYLDHLGIENYMPRRVLPNALASELLPDEALMEPTAFSTADAPTDQTVASTQSTSQHVDSTPVDVAPDHHSAVNTSSVNVLDELLGKKSENTAPIDKPTTDTADTPPHNNINNDKLSAEPVSSSDLSAATPIRFSLTVWRITQDIMVVDSRQPGAALPTDRLLQNILRSIGCPLAQLPPSELLRWPLFATKGTSTVDPESDASEARAMVHAYISAQCTKAPVKWLLLMGDDAIRFALTPDTEQNASDTLMFDQYKGRAIVQAQWQCTALVTPSLVDMLQEPLQKRTTWQALQAVL